MVEQSPRGELTRELTRELERTRREQEMLAEQLTAVTEVLYAVGRHAADPEVVLSSLVESARSLCDADVAHLYLFEDGVYRRTNTVGLSAESIAYMDEHPIQLDRDTLTGRTGLDRTGPVRTRAGPDRPALLAHAEGD